jgi:hypothetical protein
VTDQIMAATIPAAAHGGRFSPDPPPFIVIHSTEGPMSPGNARALAENWFGRPKSEGGAGTSATDIFDPREGITMLDDHTVPYHCGPAGNGLGAGDEHCGRVSMPPEQWMSPDGQAMLDRSARRNAQRAHARGWGLAQCRWLSLTEVRNHVAGFCTHNDIRLALGGTTHSDPGPNFPYNWYMSRIRFWFSNPNGDDVLADERAALFQTKEWVGQIGLRVPDDMVDLLKPLQADIDTLDRRTLYLQAVLLQNAAWVGAPLVAYRQDGVYPDPVQPTPDPPADPPQPPTS